MNTKISGHNEGDGAALTHEEAYGVFDTADWLGAFGAKRAP